MDAFRVAVVGAGVAGLVCARMLARNASCNVQVFDKARGPGGRLSTRRRGPLEFDHGAQYFTCRTPQFQSQVHDWLEQGVAAPWKGRVATLDGGEFRIETADDTRYVGTPRMSTLGRSLAQGLDVALERRVERLRLEPGAARGRWGVQFDDGDSESGFDAVVLAVPAPQAVPLLAARPQLAERVSSVPMQPCHAVMVAFEKPVDVAFEAAFVKRSPLSWVAMNASKPGRADASTWVLQTTVEWSEANVTADAEDLGPVLLEAFEAAIGVTLPDVQHLAVHRWLYARSERPLGEACLFDEAHALGVCGDWMVGGRVEGAFESGAALASAMSARMGASGS